MTEAFHVLLVDDNPGDVRLVREALRTNGFDGRLHVARDGRKALRFLRSTYPDLPRPDLVLLDLNLPAMDGGEVLEEIKGDPDLRTIPVVVLTGSSAEEDVAASYDRHANAYVTKPVDHEDYQDMTRMFAEFWTGHVRLPPRGDGP